jgi:pantothenate kinase type III
MMLSAMHHFTAQLPDLELTNDPGDRFDDTAPAMRAGALVGSAGAIQSAVDVLKRRSKRSGIPVFVTGGHAARLRKKLPSGWKYLPDLTLIGLGDIARLNSSAR